MDPTNMLVLMSDEHNARMLGSSGHSIVQTPNLDALAERGVRFRRLTAIRRSVCRPGQVSLLVDTCIRLVRGTTLPHIQALLPRVGGIVWPTAGFR